MKQSAQPVLRDLVLVGGGHSHVGVLRMFAMQPEPGVRLTLVCTDVETPYSGMLPGYLAGHYGFDEVHIDLARLCGAAGARFIEAAVTGIDRKQQIIRLAGRPPLPYDRLSINIGSTPQAQSIPGASAYAVPVKPIAGFNQHWLKLLDELERLPSQGPPMTIAVVGGGAGGVELLLAVRHRLIEELRARGQDPQRLRFILLTAGEHILPTHHQRVRQRFERLLTERAVSVHRSAKVIEVGPRHLLCADGRRFEADKILWVTQAGGPDWLKATGLKLDQSGFIQVNSRLQTLDDPLIFAAGDIASFVEHPLEKAGVFAVRMGRPLGLNLRRSLREQQLVEWRPQRHWLALISTGDRYAVASRGAIGFAGHWVWRWKDWIDRRFMRRFSELPTMNRAAPAARIKLSDEESSQALSAIAMRCGGCGAKVGASVLTRALADLNPIARDDVVVGLHAPDDAAVIQVPPSKALVHSVDFFRAFIDDPYLFGRIAANHALGDLFAMGAQAQSATAIATVPPGLERKTEELLRQMMQGAVEVLNEAGCALVGGHTGEGEELALGFAVNGLIDSDLSGLMTKAGLRAGDALILTKPIGTGTLFAAHARQSARGRWISAALASMQRSNQPAAAILRQHGASACTDLTGFGLLGHLVEMIRASGVDVMLNLSALPLLEGALDCVKAGLVSSLQPANLRLRRAIRNPEAWVDDPRYKLLFDPQTAGGLIAGVPMAAAAECLKALHAAGDPASALIGRVIPAGESLEPVMLIA